MSTKATTQGAHNGGLIPRCKEYEAEKTAPLREEEGKQKNGKAEDDNLRANGHIRGGENEENSRSDEDHQPTAARR